MKPLKYISMFRFTMCGTCATFLPVFIKEKCSAMVKYDMALQNRNVMPFRLKLFMIYSMPLCTCTLQNKGNELKFVLCTV